MGFFDIITAAGSFMQTPGDKAVFERKASGRLVAVLTHNGHKKSFVKYPNGTVVETIVKKAIKGKK